MNMGLDMLGELGLSSRGQRAFDVALASNRGAAVWRSRKVVEARELIALAELAPAGRMRIEYLDLADELRAVCRLGVPAAWRGVDGAVHTADSATIGLVYPARALTEQLPSFGFVQILAPRTTFHPAISDEGPLAQVLCLGDLPAGTRVTELILLTYAALAMQNIRLDAFEAVGVMNVPAARYWHERQASLPLTRRAFLETD